MKKINLKELTLKEKISLLTGANDWQTSDADGKVKQLFLSDGPAGLRMIDIDTNETFQATALPTCHVLSHTWDTTLAFEYAALIGEEAILHDADILLAPGVNIKRTPLCGRNFEYLSEDPYLSGLLGKAYVEGVQSKGIGACVKHYCANNREYDRFNQSSEVSDRALHEIYIRPFEIALEAKPWTVMCSYNPINGIYASENKKLLNDVLRKQLGYDGLIMSDWGAVHNPVRAVDATLDLCMPHRGDYADLVLQAVKDGKLTETQIDERAQKILELAEKSESTAEKRKVESTVKERHEKAVKIAREGIVLLKNERNVLPLTGEQGEKRRVFLYCDYGNFRIIPPISATGSGQVRTEFKQPLLDRLLAEKSGAEVTTYVSDRWNKNRRYCYQKAYDADVTVIAIGSSRETEGEGLDRDTIRLTEEQEESIRQMAAHSNKTAVVVYGGAAVDMSRWIDTVDAVVFAGYAGEGVQEALSDLLCGKANFVGKLTETFPMTIEDTYKGGKSFDGETDVYGDGIFVGYRYYDKYEKEVLFPFGHGLSYSNFEYRNLRIEKVGETDFDVIYDVTNNSDRAGKEISQVYVHDVSAMVHRPLRELRGFSKDEIGAHETKTIRVRLDHTAFEYYSTSLDKWYLENGWFEIYVGSSSRNLPLKEKLFIQLPDDTQYST